MTTCTRLRGAFTLIELMLALGFAVVIMVVAAQAFNAITNTINAINRLSQENELLRSGFWTALHNIDYWDVEASAELPYFRVHNRFSRTDTDDIRKRSFSPVVFTARSDDDFDHDNHGSAARTNAADINARPIQNPHVLLPHDPRSFYRNGLFGTDVPGWVSATSSTPGIDNRWESAGNWPGGSSPRLILGDYGLHQATIMPFTGPNERFRTIDWLARERDTLEMAVPGIATYGEVFDSTLDPALRLTEHGVLSARPRAFWQIQQRLGHFASAQYLPTGLPFLIVDQLGMWPRHTSAPFISAPGLEALDLQRPDATGTIAPHHIPDAMKSFNSYLGYAENGRLAPYQTNADVLNAMSRGGLDWFSALGGSALVIWPSRWPQELSQSEGSGSDYKRMGKDLFYNFSPFRVRSRSTRFGAQGNDGLKATFHPVLTAHTTLLPLNLSDQEREAVFNAAHSITDDDLASELKARFPDEMPADLSQIRRDMRILDYDSRPANSPILQLNSLRYHRVDGALLNIFTVRVERPDDGRLIIMRLTPTGTSYRGARQHWARRHLRADGKLPGEPNNADAQGNPPIGDFYVYDY